MAHHSIEETALGAAGSMAGAAIGSCIGLLGGPHGAVIGGVAGAGLGKAMGDALENILEDAREAVAITTTATIDPVGLRYLGRGLRGLWDAGVGGP